jgi:hypothetical protein
MFPRPLRFVLIGVSSAYGLYYVTHGQAIGYLYLFGAALLIYGYFRYGPVFIAFNHVRRGNYERAASLLAQVRDPELLSSQQRGYFELASAELAVRKGNLVHGERHVRAALARKLRTENDRAVAEVMLAQLLFQRGADAEARAALEQARGRRTNPQTAKMIEDVEKSCDADKEPPATPVAGAPADS